MSELIIQVGDLFRVALPGNRFAFGCVLRDACVGIYSGIEDDPMPPADLTQRPFTFVTGIYSDILPSGICPIVGRREFASENEQWPPPQCVLDPVTKTASIYY